MLHRLALLALSTLLLGCLLRTGAAAVSLPPPGSIAPATLTTGSPRGFYTLYVGRTTPDIVRKAWFVTSQAELSALWEKAEIEWPMPEVDFDAYVVAAFADEDDGCVEELVSFALDDRGVPRPKLLHMGAPECTLNLLATVYVAALARAALPSHVVLKLARRRGHTHDIDVEPTAAVTFAEPGKEPGPEDTGELGGPIGQLRATLPLPPRGTVKASYLDDGTPVWVVHHEGGEVSVLSAFSAHHRPPGHEANPLYLTSWDGYLRRFDGGYDERGVPVLGRARPSLSRYRTEVVSGPACTAEPSSRCVRVGDLAPGSPRRHAMLRPEPRPTQSGLDSAHAYTRGNNQGLSIREALSRHEGRVVLLDAAFVVENDEAHVCGGAQFGSGLEDGRCLERAPVAGPPPWECYGCGHVTEGPLFARVERGRFRDIVFTSHDGGSYAVKEVKGAKRPAELDMIREIGAGVTAAFGESGLSGGTEVSWGLQSTYVYNRDPTSTAMRVLVGNIFGFDLRAQLTHRGEGAGVETGVALGIAGRLNQYHDNASLRLPSLLGLFAPEIGVLFDSREPPRFYTGASLPIAFRRQNLAFYGLELWPTLRYVPETGAFTGVVSLKGLSRW